LDYRKVEGHLMGKKRLVHSFEIICPAGSSDGVDDFLDNFFSKVPLSYELGLKFLFWVFWWMPLFVTKRLKCAGKLSEVEREAYLVWWEDNPAYVVRNLFELLKTLSLLARVGKEWNPI
jgi:hypothetical protein